jgi:hypothetical protein
VDLTSHVRRDDVEILQRRKERIDVMHVFEDLKIRRQRRLREFYQQNIVTPIYDHVFSHLGPWKSGLAAELLSASFLGSRHTI